MKETRKNRRPLARHIQTAEETVSRHEPVGSEKKGILKKIQGYHKVQK